MPRLRRMPRLCWRHDRGVWEIRYYRERISTGTDDRNEAEQQLRAYRAACDTLTVESSAMRDAIYKAIRGAKWRASKRQQACALTIDGVLDIVRKQGGVCAMSGMPFDPMPSDSGRRKPFMPSLDRINNDKGYTPENVQVVVSIANTAKGDFAESEFIKMCRAVARYKRKPHRNGTKPNRADRASV